MLCILFSGLDVHLCFVKNGKSDWLPYHYRLEQLEAIEIKKIMSEILRTWSKSVPLNDTIKNSTFNYTCIIPTWLPRYQAQRIFQHFDSKEVFNAKCNYFGYLQEAYAQSASINELKGNTLIVDSTDAFLSVYVIEKNQARQESTQENLKLIPTAGSSIFEKEILQNGIKKFQNLGLALTDSDIQKLEKQLNKNLFTNVLKLYHQNEEGYLESVVNLQQEEIKEIHLKSIKSLSKYINFDYLKKKYIYNVIFLGKYLENSYLNIYFVTELGLESKLFNVHKNLNVTDIFDSVVKEAVSLAKYQQHILPSHKKSLHLKQHSKKELIADIQQTCRDINLLDTYLEKFLPHAIQLDMSSEVLEWLIVESLIDKTNVTSKPELFNDDSSSKKNVATVATAVSQQSLTDNKTKNQHLDIDIQHQEVGVITTKDDVTEDDLLNALSDEFEMQHFLFRQNGVFAMKAKVRATNLPMVIYAITADTIPRTVLLQQFQDCYRRSSLLFQETSDIFSIREGCYFYRDFIEGETLESYSIASGFSNRKSVKDFGVDDLKLILMVWKLINSIKFSFRPIRSNDIVVVSRLKWNLKREFRLELVGLNGTSCSQEEMFASVHQLFENILGHQLYHSFRKKFKL